MGDEKGKNKKKKDDAPVVWSELDYTCDYCRKDISSTVRIKCADCVDEMDLCIECFSMGVEFRKHSNSHAFRIIDNMQFPLFTQDWSADEEQLMLEGLEQNGWGNWEDVSGHVNTKTKAEVREHYMSLYHCPPTWLPETVRPLSSRQDVINYNRDPSLLDQVAPRLRGPRRTSTKVVMAKPQPSRPVRPDLANFMPARGEFEHEWNNDAEMSIKDILFEPDEPQADIDVKLKLLEIYNLRLDERDEKRQFVIERGLHDTKKTKEAEKRRGKEERELMAKTKKFLSLPAMSGEAYDTFIDNLYAEQLLRQKIAEYQQYRTLGLRTIADIEAYKADLAAADAAPRRGRPSAGKKPAQDDRYIKKGFVGGTRSGRGLLASSSSGYLPDASKSASSDWISDLEREVASALRLDPDQYYNMKETMIREYIKRGEIKRYHLRQLFKSDPRTLTTLFDFWEECGWLNKRTGQQQTQHATQQLATGMTTRGSLQQQPGVHSGYQQHYQQGYGQSSQMARGSQTNRSMQPMSAARQYHPPR